MEYDPFKEPGPKRIPEKAIENLTLSADKSRLLSPAKKTLQKPYVAAELDEALKERGMGLDFFADKLMQLAEATVLVEEPVLVPLTDDSGDLVTESIVVDGIPKERPILSPLYVLKPDGKAVKATKVVKKPDLASLKFVLETYKELLITKTNNVNEGAKVETSDIVKLAETLANNVPLLQNVKKSMGIEAEFDDIA